MEKLKKFKTWAKRKWPLLAVIILAVIFFFGASSYNYLTQADGFAKWSSPDETANYIFSKLYGQSGQMQVFEKYNLISGDIIHPRSFGSANGNLKPVSFLGIILIYGFLAGLTSFKILPFLTPAFAALGIVFFYLLIKKLFGPRNGLISAFLLASFPPYIYYSARSMFHNVLFVVLLIFGLYFGLLAAGKKYGWRKLDLLNWLFIALSGFLLGLAIITRTSELLWLGPMLVIIWLFNVKKIGFTKLIFFLSALFLAILPVLYWDQILYGSPMAGGYPEMNQSIETLVESGGDLVKATAVGNLAYSREMFNKIKGAIFHFGFAPRQSIRMLYYYFANMFPWLFWPAVLGGLLFFQKLLRWRKRHLVYLIVYGIISVILLFYYGSWIFHDNPDPRSFTIGNSYTRYWLPIYLGALPFASLFLIKFTKAIFPGFSQKSELENGGGNSLNKAVLPAIGNFLKGQCKRLRIIFFVNSSRVILIALVYFISISFVLFGSEEGLVYSVESQRKSKYELERILELTESNSVIITRYHDKVFFPERKVIVGLFDDDSMNARYGKLINYLPVYYYNFILPEKDLNYLNEEKLKAVNLMITPVEKITGDFTLYALAKYEPR
ncbi:MAG: glycosyltransferase family 39 protein [Patescibacteria group bacterium]|nr:glycosyltransferase family 39 protein [Patescibacteria group bacterium]MDD5294447.1 glycosyltransferase family 39 protein [Patescibacteria group bacterium]MDD5554997.1 glycosyltransferase family 39 protein [Patescibacteria group bacterium]